MVLRRSSSKRTTRHTTRHTNQKGVHSIPELRRSFTHIEEFVDTMIRQHVSKETIIKRIRDEWFKVFMKKLDKKSADSFVSERMSSGISTKNQKGGSHGAIAGAPLEYTTRQGDYQDHGSYSGYIANGFFPEIAQGDDPVIGQSPWPVPYYSSKGGTRRVNKGTRGQKRRIRHVTKGITKGVTNGVTKGVTKGGYLDISGTLEQAFTRPFASSNPSSIGSDLQGALYGKEGGMSPDQIQREVHHYSSWPRAVNIS